MGGAEKRELISRLNILLLHLLKWRYQPGKRGPSWEANIKSSATGSTTSRRQPEPEAYRCRRRWPPRMAPQALASAYRDAALEAVAETGLAGSTFPEKCPWTAEQVLDEEFWSE